MLEFLKDCVPTSVYERAMDCEYLRVYNSRVMMQTFFEIMLKLLYSDYSPSESINKVDRMKISQMLNDKYFCKYVKNILPSFDVFSIRELSNHEANPGKHSIDYQKTSEEKQVKSSFKMVFDFAADYYAYKKKAPRPKWNENDYKKIYTSINPNAREKVESLLKEKETELASLKAANKVMEVQLAEFEKAIDKTSDFSEKERIRRDYEATQEALLQSKDSISELQDQVDSYRKKYTLAQTEMESIQNKYNDALAENERLHAEANKLTALAEWPKCSVCGYPMKVSPSKFGDGYYWACSKYGRQPGSCPGCGFQAATPQQIPLIQKFYKIDKLPMKSAKVTAQVASESTLAKSRNKIIRYVADPISFTNNRPVSFLFQSISLPFHIFKSQKELNIKDFSKFFVMSSLDKKEVPKVERTIYSMILRLLNRGVVIPTARELSEKLKAEFDDGTKGDILLLPELATYNSPINYYDSPREKAFAEYYFPLVLGNCWASYVTPQAGFDVLVPESKEFKDQRVDFLVNYHDVKLIIELDGDEHNISKETDATRNAILNNNGYTVLRFLNQDVDKHSPKILSSLQKHLQKSNKSIKVDASNKYLLACKLVHQLSIAIVKALEQGYIGKKSNLKFSCDIALFTKKEMSRLLEYAAVEVSTIIKNFGLIYSTNIDVDFFTNSLSQINIQYGNGTASNSIIIRDAALPGNYLCRIEPMDIAVLPKKADPKALSFFLHYLFGFDSFRTGQLEAIKRLILRKDSIVLLPTGAGKSVIYQLSSFIVPGIIIVISPLRSLIADQIINLEDRAGITNAIPIYSMETEDKYERLELARTKMRHNSSSLLYIAPERLQMPEFCDDIDILLENNNIFAVAIDEAHCVSEWGHEFRAPYLNIGYVSRDLFKKNEYVPSIIALTGTASEAVLRDVQRDLGIVGRSSLVQPPTFDRDELTFSVRTCPSEDKVTTIASILQNDMPSMLGVDYNTFTDVGNENTQSGIVFTPNAASKRKGVYDAFSVQHSLRRMLPEIKSQCYFSKVPEGYAEATWQAAIVENAQRFKNNQIGLLVATKAYGMGIDKPNIRYTIHDGIPSSFEAFYQEAGRAGRDGNHSECVVVFSNNDEKSNDALLDMSLSLEELRGRYEVSDSDDDISKVMYFHLQSFLGVDPECKVVDSLIDLISNETVEKGKRIERNIVVESQRRNDIAKALVRLRMLGIIDRYMFDYRGHYTLLMGSILRTDVIKKYLAHVRSFSVGQVATERAKIEAIKGDDWAFAKQAIHLLIQFVYEHIESNRRNCLRNMYLATKTAAALPPEEQNSYFHKYIVSYFKSNDKVQAIYDSKSAGLEEVEKLFVFSPNFVNTDPEDAIEADELLPAIEHLRESKARHPGLLYSSAIARVKAGQYNQQVVSNDIASATLFAINEYGTSKESLGKFLPKVLNLVLNASQELFKDTVEKMFKRCDFERAELFEMLVVSPDISDSNRDYLLVDYALEMTKKIRR